MRESLKLSIIQNTAIISKLLGLYWWCHKIQCFMRMNINENIIFSEGLRMDPSEFWTQKSLAAIRFFESCLSYPCLVRLWYATKTLALERAMFRSRIPRKVTGLLLALTQAFYRHQLASLWYRFLLQIAKQGRGNVLTQLCACFRGLNIVLLWLNGFLDVEI